MQPVETVEVVHVYERTVWVEADFFGNKHVMVHHQAPGEEPFCYCTFFYDCKHTDNASIRRAAGRMAVALGAVEPVEIRNRQPREHMGAPEKGECLKDG
jgi:hypothetical protein